MEKIKIDVVKIIINTTKKYEIGLTIHMKINQIDIIFLLFSKNIYKKTSPLITKINNNSKLLLDYE
jgi:hypothetical protein